MGIQQATIQAAQNQKQRSTKVLPKLLKLKIGEKVMLEINIDIQVRLINDQTGNTRHIEFAQGSVCKVYVNFFGEQAGLKAMKSSYLQRKNFWVFIEK